MIYTEGGEDPSGNTETITQFPVTEIYLNYVCCVLDAQLQASGVACSMAQSFVLSMKNLVSDIQTKTKEAILNNIPPVHWAKVEV